MRRGQGERHLTEVIIHYGVHVHCRGRVIPERFYKIADRRWDTDVHRLVAQLALVRKEEVRPVFLDRSPNSSTELLDFEIGLGSYGTDDCAKATGGGQRRQLCQTGNGRALLRD